MQQLSDLNISMTGSFSVCAVSTICDIIFSALDANERMMKDMRDLNRRHCTYCCPHA
jgi:hypothetical protein